jgi:hypothetical protein
LVRSWFVMAGYLVRLSVASWRPGNMLAAYLAPGIQIEQEAIDLDYPGVQ